MERLPEEVSGALVGAVRPRDVGRGRLESGAEVPDGRQHFLGELPGERFVARGVKALQSRQGGQRWGQMLEAVLRRWSTRAGIQCECSWGVGAVLQCPWSVGAVLQCPRSVGAVRCDCLRECKLSGAIDSPGNFE